MARRELRDRKKKRDGLKKRVFRKKTCKYCAEHVAYIDYKDTPKLSRILTERSKIVPRRVSGNCAKHQRMLASAIKRARFVAFLPYTVE